MIGLSCSQFYSWMDLSLILLRLRNLSMIRLKPEKSGFQSELNLQHSCLPDETLLRQIAAIHSVYAEADCSYSMRMYHK
ncbi:MAG: hypothetical protein B6D70_10060 [gamma proteobacterium symbiont of Stewartia floridana]|nr:MAG: hypothetical protein B6D70_10060 [gamma proteobacterium symbiont of Stewartia floridana]RLW66708.1 MAG: hypothetical protein B6D73_01720 [gamma proteobacterium symbiont of Stewartia floridana]